MWCNYRFVAHICLNICPGLRDPNDEKLRFRGTFTYVHAQQRNRGTAVLRRTQLTAILYHGNTAVQIPDKQTAGKPEKKNSRDISRPSSPGVGSERVRHDDAVGKMRLGTHSLNLGIIWSPTRGRQRWMRHHLNSGGVGLGPYYRRGCTFKL